MDAETHEDAGGAGSVGTAQGPTVERAEALRREFLREATDLLAQSLDWNETLARVARLAIPRLADFCLVDIVEPDGVIRGVAVADINPAKEVLLREMRRRFAPAAHTPNPAWRVIQAGQSELLPEVDASVLAARTRNVEHAQLLREIGVRSHLAVPLRLEGRVIGALSFGYSSSQRRYGEDDLRVVEELARAAARAIERARLHASERAAREQSERAVAKLARLQELAAGLSQALSTLDVGRVVVNIGVPAARAVSGSVFLLAGDKLSRVFGTGFPPDCTLPVLEFPLSAPLPVARAVVLERPVVSATRASFEAEFPALAARLVDHQAFVALPLSFNGSVIGGLALGFDAPLEDTRDELDVLLAIARQCGQAFERARLFEAERHARSVAEAADRAKDGFIAMLSHELRNPLSALMNAVSLIGRDTVSAEIQRRAREIIHRQGQLMTRMVDDLLDVSRISKGKIELACQPLELVTLVEESARDFSGLAASHGLTLEVDAPVRPITVSADPTRLAQVLGNLLSNALKFSAAGGAIRLCVRLSTDEVTVSVQDEGAGIPADVLPTLFTPFVQADTSLDRQRGGLGLGLAVSKGLIEQHGGRVAVHSEGQGKGATVSFTLPLLPAVAPAGIAEGTPSVEAAPARRRVLLIEDNADAAEMLADLLQLDGYEVSVAADGRSGVEQALARSPDIIICDVGLPVLDGYGVVQALRGHASMAETLIIALTGYGQSSDRAQALGRGFDAHLTKPVEYAELLQLLKTRGQGRAASEH